MASENDRREGRAPAATPLHLQPPCPHQTPLEICEPLGTDPRSGQGRGVALGRVVTRVRRWGARGGAKSAGSLTPAHSVPRAQPAAWTGQDIDPKRAPHQLGPLIAPTRDAGARLVSASGAPDDSASAASSSASAVAGTSADRQAAARKDALVELRRTVESDARFIGGRKAAPPAIERRSPCHPTRPVNPA